MAFIPAEKIIDDDQPEDLKRPKSFKEHYADPEYKKKHLARMQERIECPICGIKISRSNMSKHKNTRRHQVVSVKIQEVIAKVKLEKICDMYEKFIQSIKGT